jgi:hypothetical protein
MGSCAVQLICNSLDKFFPRLTLIDFAGPLGEAGDASGGRDFRLSFAPPDSRGGCPHILGFTPPDSRGGCRYVGGRCFLAKA